jgi:hypothetical protein
MGDTDADVAELQKMLSAEKSESGNDPLKATIDAPFRRDNMLRPLLKGMAQ